MILVFYLLALYLGPVVYLLVLYGVRDGCLGDPNGPGARPEPVGVHPGRGTGRPGVPKGDTHLQTQPPQITSLPRVFTNLHTVTLTCCRTSKSVSTLITGVSNTSNPGD